MTGLARYRAALGAPGMARLVLTAVIGRLPIGMNELAIVLFVRARTHSYVDAGAAVAAFDVVVAIGAVTFGRAVDRLGPRVVFPRLVALQVVAMATLIVLGLSGAPGIALVAASALVGAGQPPWTSVMRTLFPMLLDDAALLSTLYAFDAVLVEISFVGGPLLTAALASLVDPAAALAASALAVSVGSLAFIRMPAVRRWPSKARGRRPHPLGALRNPAVATIVLATLPIGFTFGTINVALPAFAQHHGSPNGAGPLAAVWALGSALGGVTYGARHWGRPLPQMWAGLSCLMAASVIPLLLPSTMVEMGLLLALAGATIAPMGSAGAQLLGIAAPEGMTTEAYSWGTTAIVLGMAAGSGGSGVLIAHAGGWRASILAAVIASMVGAVVAVTRRGRVWTAEPLGEDDRRESSGSAGQHPAAPRQHA